jgi:peptidoglycan/xylan/chitin deacetylase (PgdA/CDA1 family)
MVRSCERRPEGRGWATLCVVAALAPVGAALMASCNPVPATSPRATAGMVSPVVSASPATVVTEGNPRVRAVALTFDAGSDAGATSSILATLDRHGIHATFGITGLWAQAYPSLVRRIAADGDQIVNHTWDHRSLTGASTSTSALSPDQILTELAPADVRIRELIGQTTQPWFRPPYGDRSARVDTAAGAAGYHYDLLWTVDSLGWEGVAPATALRRTLAAARPGAIILMHVGSGSTDASMLPALVDQLIARGFGFRTVAQLLAAPSFAYSVARVSAARQSWMRGRTWRPGCPVPLSALRELRLRYWGFDGAVHAGLLIVNAQAVGPLVAAFRQLFDSAFPIRKMLAVDAFGGDDERSMRADNTSVFNCRLVPGTHVWSQHAYGLAVDINPFENPEVHGGVVDPPAAWRNADRSRGVRGMIVHGGINWRAFQAIGWPWGGDWNSPKDYMHFSKNGL